MDVPKCNISKVKATRFGVESACNSTLPLVRNPTDMDCSAYLLTLTSVAPDMETKWADATLTEL